MYEIKFKGLFGRRYSKVVRWNYESHVGTEVDSKLVLTPVEIGISIETSDGNLHFEPAATKRPWSIKKTSVSMKEAPGATHTAEP